MDKRAEEMLRLLKKEYPGVKIALDFKSPMELLVATILSAQCTDVRVNIVTKGLFKKYRSSKDYAAADIRSFEEQIRSTGFYHAKAKSVLGAAKMIEKDFGGKVPDSMDELIKLPGVGRKTANVVLFNAFNKTEGMAVDTHVKRVSRRLGLTKNDDPVKIEQDLMRILDKKEWGIFSHTLIMHGRRTCAALKPKCLECVLRNVCPSKKMYYPNTGGRA